MLSPVQILQIWQQQESQYKIWTAMDLSGIVAKETEKTKNPGNHQFAWLHQANHTLERQQVDQGIKGKDSKAHGWVKR